GLSYPACLQRAERKPDRPVQADRRRHARLANPGGVQASQVLKRRERRLVGEAFDRLMRDAVPSDSNGGIDARPTRAGDHQSPELGDYQPGGQFPRKSFSFL
ncbi:MAG: hypothetical protein ACJ76V_03455, partial [Thermoleophilaceae bacterium]